MCDFSRKSAQLSKLLFCPVACNTVDHLNFVELFQPTQLASDLLPISTGENDNGSSLFGNRSVSANGLSDRHTPGFKSPWGQQSGNSGADGNGDETDEPVFIDKMPWIGDGGDRVRNSSQYLIIV